MVSVATKEPAPGRLARLLAIYRGAAGVAAKLESLALLGARLLIARVFLLSGLTKWDGLTIREDTFYLFADEYFARYALPPAVVNGFAVAASVAEVALPVLLIVGVFTRAAALGLLVMTLVIQIFVYPDAWWTVHVWWVTVLGLIVVRGPGALSADRRLKLD